VPKAIPRLSPRTTNSIRLEKAGVDVIPRLLTACMLPTTTDVNLVVLTGTDAKFSFNPMHALNT